MLGLSLTQVLHDLGYVGLWLLMIAETVFPPIPSEAVLPLAGYLAERGQFNLAAVLAASTAGSVMGAAALYEAARIGGRPFAMRFLRFARLEEAQLDRAEVWFSRRGPLLVLVGRCIPGIRSLISLPAGLLRMPRWEYLLFTLLGSALWNALLIGAGYALGSQWQSVSDLIAPVGKPVVAVAVVAAGAFLWRRARRRHRQQQPPGRVRG
jgi:membrane protein DedA with SNARE-associated domain